MRGMLPLVLTGCVAGGGAIPNTQDTDPSQGCAAIGADYVQASTANFSFNNLLVNGATVGTDVATITACLQADGGGAAWLINDSSGVPYMTLINETTQTGSLSMDTGYFYVDIYGNDPQIQFEGADFYTNQWVVNSLSPFSASFQGQATNGDGHQLDLNYFATASQ